MPYPVERVTPTNIIIGQEGLQYANFVSVRAIATQDMLADGATFDVDTYRTYGGTEDVGEDFDTDSDAYQMAEQWFSQQPSPGAESFQIWMWDDDESTGDTIVETINKSINQAKWMFGIAIPTYVYQEMESESLDIASLAGSTNQLVPLTFQNPDSLDENIDTDIPTVLNDLGIRFVTQKFRSQSLVDTDASQAYASLAEFAWFQRFNFDGVATSTDPEYKSLQNVLPEDLRPSQYTALEDRKLGFYTNFDLKGSEVAGVRGSWTTSSFNETLADVFEMEVFKNRLQVDGFNYLRTKKRGLRRPRDYAGLLQTYEAVAKQANECGILASDVPIVDPRTGEEVIAKYGFLMISEPEDVQGLTSAQISAREYPPVQMIVAPAYSARIVELNVYVE